MEGPKGELLLEAKYYCRNNKSRKYEGTSSWMCM